ncbi:winged helix-turn-helix transcriptional regulator [Streptomyces sp. NPDC048436]|uniref:winged helix-turn-helix transcriptional regulator n=1 Tax=Streptomyces sp. NPDC048436 TaxID=3365550 RepID=UPI00371B6F56
MTPDRSQSHHRAPTCRLFGVGRFGALKRALGIWANILTARLNNLTELGLLTKRAYRSDKPWYEYQLSDSARELVVPAIAAITRWAETYATDSDITHHPVVHTVCGNPTKPCLACSSCHQPVEASNPGRRPLRGRASRCWCRRSGATG